MNVIDSFRDEYEFLSNFYPCKIVIDGIQYQNAEAAFQAQKTLDIDERKKFTSYSPVRAKHYGRKVTLRDDWEDIKLDVMLEVVSEKFKQNPHLLESLMRTGDAILIEGNTWHDYFWGVCRNKGQNHLGKILMKVRNAYKQI